jgi:hypothetical protein
VAGERSRVRDLRRENDMMGYAQPFYSAAIKTSGVAFDLRVNDCPIASHERRALSTVVRLNEWLHDGVNRFSLELRPLAGETGLRPEAAVTAKIRVRENQGDSYDLVCELAFRGGRMYLNGPVDSQQKDIPIELFERPGGALFGLQPVALRVPFGNWAWRTSNAIRDSEGVRLSLMTEIDRLHALFAANQLDEVLAACQERSSEWAQAYYGEYQDAVDATRSTLERITREPTFSLQPCLRDDLRLHLYGNGTIAYLTNQLHESTLYYADAAQQVIGQVRFMFRLAASRRWVICR